MIVIDFKDFPQEFDKFPTMEDLSAEQQNYINENGITDFANKFPSTVADVDGKKISKVFLSAFHINWIANMLKNLHQAFKRMWTDQGTYSSSKYYYKGDLILYNNQTYLCLKDCIGISPSNTGYWRLMSFSPTISTNKEGVVTTLFV